MPTTLLLAHPNLKNQQHLCYWLVDATISASEKDLPAGKKKNSSLQKRNHLDLTSRNLLIKVLPRCSSV